MDRSEKKVPVKIIVIGIVFVIGIIALLMTCGINDAGHRTVIQYPTGTMKVKLSPGIYPKWFGSATVYNDVITFDFDKTQSEAEASLDQPGIAVRYQDGGTGTVFGKIRFTLPSDEVTMLKLHKDFRSNNGVAQKLIKSVSEEGMNLTAGLMTSEEAYAEKRSIFTQWSQQQIAEGKFQTELKEVVDESDATGKKVKKNIPVIKYGEDGRPIQLHSDLKTYGVGVSGYQITDWDFEKKTLDQISSKREATMAIITAKANAERAKQDAITAEEQGKANVMKAKYEKEVLKQQAVVEAEKVKEVAVIAASQKVDVAEQTKLEAVIAASQKVDVAAQEKLEAEQKKLAAAEYKEEQILRGEGESEYKRLVMEADGALQQKLDAYVNIMTAFANAVSKQKWVPEVMMAGSGGTGGSEGNAASDLIQIFTAKSLKDLGLDMSIKAAKAKP